ncbi:hypothetical protein HYW68_02625 [Candidatus Parcubacteria bacterium]|nr:hypothetical protein [Candidatus Parcubacteria bacterium]
MAGFQLFAHPWWVNLVFAVPFGAYLVWRRQGLAISPKTLALAAIFGVAFGFVEAAVVVYLRAAVGLTDPALIGNLDALGKLSGRLLVVELFREAATLAMLVAFALLAAPTRRERWAVLLWTFAIWDIAYYAGLWATVRWPQSLTTPDVLFLIPVPWLAPVWFPILVSAFTVFAVLAARRSGAGER